MKKALIILGILFSVITVFAEAKTNRNNLFQEQSRLNDSISYYLEQGEFTSAIPLIEKDLIVTQKIYGKKSEEYAINLSNAADVYALVSDYNSAINLAERALKIKEIVFGKKHIEYAISLDNLGGYYEKEGNSDKAVELQKDALEIFKNQEGIYSENYIICLINIIETCISNDKLNELNSHKPKIFESFESLFDIDSLLIEQIAEYYAKKGQKQDALNIYKEWLHSISQIYGVNSEAYASDLKNFAEKSFEIGEYSLAIEYASQSAELYRNLYGEKNENYISLQMNLSGYNYYGGKYSEAIKCGENAVDLILKYYGETNLDYPNALDNLSRLYTVIGYYDKAIEIGHKALSLFDNNSVDYAIALSNLAGIYHGIGNIQKAIELESKANNTFVKLNQFGECNINIIHSVFSLSTYFRENGQNIEATNYALESIDLAQKEYSEKHPIFAEYYNNLAECYFELGKYNEAIEYELKTKSIIENTLGCTHPYYVICITTLSRIYYGKGDLKTAMKYIRDAAKLYNSEIITHFSTLTTLERESLWNKRKQWYEIMLLLSYLHSESMSINETYNSVLLSKGILLNSEIEFSKLIVESGDEEVKGLYSRLQSNRSLLNKLYEMPIAERLVDVDSIEKATMAIERQLVQKSKVYGDFTHNMKIDWKQVQSSLKDEDIAIEFLSFPTLNDSIMYCALTVKKGHESPQMIELFESKQLSAIAPEDYYEDAEISKLVWGPLMQELDGVKNVYFAPAGEFYNIAIESLKNFDGEGFLFDKWNFYRLSSTRELVLRKNDKNEQNIALYGGLRYDAKNFVKDSIVEEEFKNSIPRSLPDSLATRAGRRYLEYTLYEVQQIDSLYKKYGIPTKLYTDTINIGSETSLKRLSGAKLSNLHISTHGFYWSESEANSKKEYLQLNFLHQDNSPRYVEDKSMTRSGLYFAGANAVLQGDTIPDGCDDGILTAQEIATLDFRGLDLLVLSACQTGLGEIKGDGVFGLQRGFKQAGVQTILMSLWEVHDAATQALMTSFYENYLLGMSKREALLAAQKKVRETPGWKAPDYWAGFILLDGLD